MILSYERREALLAEWEWELELLHQVENDLFERGFAGTVSQAEVAKQITILVLKVRFAREHLCLKETV